MTMGVDSISKDVRTGLWRQKALGFNAIRLPFTFDILTRPAIIMPGVCPVASWQTVIDSVFPPGVPSKPVPFNPPGIWGGQLPPPNGLNQCHPSSVMWPKLFLFAPATAVVLQHTLSQFPLCT